MNRCKPHFSPARRLCAGALLAGLACASLGVAAQGLPSNERAISRRRPSSASWS